MKFEDLEHIYDLTHFTDIHNCMGPFLWNGIFGGACLKGWFHESLGYVVDEYRAAFSWTHNVNEVWMGVIGALEAETVLDAEYACQCVNYDVFPAQVDTLNITDAMICSNTPDPNSNDYNHCNQIAIDPIYITQLVQEASDGVVPISSAMNMTGKEEYLYKPIELKNSTHMQMRNNEALRLALLHLYESEEASFFNTDPN